jgi:hypothetical protein
VKLHLEYLQRAVRDLARIGRSADDQEVMEDSEAWLSTREASVDALGRNEEFPRNAGIKQSVTLGETFSAGSTPGS